MPVKIYARETTARGSINKFGRLGYYLQVEYFLVTEEEEKENLKLFNKGKHIKFTLTTKEEFEAKYHFRIDTKDSETCLIYKHKLHNITKEY